MDLANDDQDPAMYADELAYSFGKASAVELAMFEQAKAETEDRRRFWQDVLAAMKAVRVW